MIFSLTSTNPFNFFFCSLFSVLSLFVYFLYTGNDFSRATGWGSEVPSAYMHMNMIALKNWVKEILLADVFNFDLWSIKIELNSTTGHFNQVQNGKTMILKHKIDGDNGEKVGDTVRVLNKMCCNYFSTGVESRIGFGFEKKRSKSHYMNKIYYGTESLKKLFLKKHVRVNEYVKKIMYEYEGEEIVVVPKDSFSSNPISLIFQNIPSMASGCDFWVGSYKYADKIREKMMKEKKDYNAELNTNLSKVKQEIGDGKIELMTIKSLCYYSKAQAGMPRGVAKRITQAKGPFSLEFNENYNNKVYFQIDGENYSCIHPISFAVKYSKSYQILVKKGSKLTKTSVQSKISESNISHLSNEKNYATRTYSNPPSPAVLTPVDMISPNASFVSDGEEGGEVGGGSRGESRGGNDNQNTRNIDEKINIKNISPPPQPYNYLTPVPLMERKWGSGDNGDGTPSDSIKGLGPLSRINKNIKNKFEGKKVLSGKNPGSPISRGNVLAPVHGRISQTGGMGAGVGIGVGERYDGRINSGDHHDCDRDADVNYHKDDNKLKKLIPKVISDEKDEDDRDDINEEIENENENENNSDNNERYLSDFLKLSHASPLK